MRSLCGPARRATTSAEALAEHCGAWLARFKVPKTFTVVDELPRSSMGKVLKDDLRASVAEAAR